MILSVINKYNTRPVDFVLTYPQVSIDHALYMKLPKGMDKKTGNGKMRVLELINNKCKQNQLGQVWNKYPTNKLLNIGFKKSAMDE